MKDLSQWIEHLNDPLVLIGFVVMLFTGVITALLKKGLIRVSQKGTERLLSNALMYAFIIALMATAFAFYKSISSKDRQGSKPMPVNEQTRKDEAKPSAPQKNIQSPHDIQSGRDVNINYGDSNEKKK